MEVINKYSQVSMEQIANKYLSKNETLPINKSETKLSFEEIFRQKQDLSAESKLKFSKHANARLVDRNINLTEGQVKRLEDGTKQANEKGIKESLMIMDDLAFIVNVKNNTVITAIDQKSSDENVFTNIDGAVIV